MPGDTGRLGLRITKMTIDFSKLRKIGYLGHLGQVISTYVRIQK